MDIVIDAFVEIINFKRFPQKVKYGAIGMVFGKVTHGLTTNYFSELVRESQIDKNGVPCVSISQASSAILYEVSSEISVALRFLQGCKWFDPQVQFITEGLAPFSEVKAMCSICGKPKGRMKNRLIRCVPL